VITHLFNLWESGDGGFLPKPKFRFEKWWLQLEEFQGVVEKSVVGIVLIDTRVWGAPPARHFFISIWSLGYYWYVTSPDSIITVHPRSVLLYIVSQIHRSC